MVQMRDWAKRILWENGRPTNARPLKAGAVTIFDLRKVWTGVRFSPIHYLCFYLPRAALRETAEQDGLLAVDELTNNYCSGNQDDTLFSLSQMILPAFAKPEQANQLFIDHVTSATAAHVLRQYGQCSRQKVVRKPTRPQRRRAEEAIAEELGGRLTIAALASECGLTPTDFVSAFHAATGMLPHQRLLYCRLDKVMNMLKWSSLSIELIAARTGFAGPGHLDRVFRQALSLGPEEWRTLVVH